MNHNSIEKTAFCPEPGYGLWEFMVMPYGLTGATQTCQRGLDDVLRDCKYCVNNYVDDCIVYLVIWCHTFETCSWFWVN